MAITAGQIDETIARVSDNLRKLQVELEVFIAGYSGYSANIRTAVKTHVSTKVTAARADLQDVIDAINALP